VIFISDNVIVNIENTSTPSSSGGLIPGQGIIETLLKYALIIAVIFGILFLIVSTYLLIDNIEWITTSLTTGFIGWLNPFDDPTDDLGPGEIVEQGVVRIPVIGPIIRIFRGF
jgi:hypothetical protein